MASKLIKQRMVDLVRPDDVDVAQCVALVDKLFATAPEIKAETVEQADELVRKVMDWQKGLPNAKTDGVQLSFKETIVLGGMLQQRLDEMHLKIETLLFDLGVVERGTENTQTADTD